MMSSAQSSTHFRSNRQLVALAAAVALVACLIWLLLYITVLGRPAASRLPQEYTDFMSKALPIVQAGPYTGVEFRYDEAAKKMYVYGPIYRAPDAVKLKADLDAITPRPELQYDFVIDKQK